MEAIISVKVTIPDDALRETIDNLDEDGSLTNETIESIFQDVVDDWIDAIEMVKTHASAVQINKRE